MWGGGGGAEIIVGDDGSSDGTVQKVREYMEKYPGRIFLQEMPRDKNKKYDPCLRVSANRMNLIEKSTGEYYLVLDGDDWYSDKTFVDEAVKILDEDRSIAVCAFNFQYVAKDSSWKNRIFIPEGKVSPREYLPKTYIHAGAFLYRRSVYEKLKNTAKKFGHYDDNSIVISNLPYGDIFFINRVVLSYRITGNSLWQSLNIYEQNAGVSSSLYLLTQLAPEFSAEIFQRYFDCLRFTFENRKILAEKVSREKYELYETRSREISGSFFYKIIHFDSLLPSEKKEVRRILRLSLPKRIQRIKKSLYEASCAILPKKLRKTLGKIRRKIIRKISGQED